MPNVFPYIRSHQQAFISRLHFSRCFVLLAGFLLIIGGLPLNTGAQLSAPQDPEQAFAAKADKLTKIVRRSATTDRLIESSRDAASGAGARGRSAHLERLSHRAVIEQQESGRTAISLIVRLKDKDSSELKNAGFTLGAQIGNIATVETSVERLPQLASLASVRKIETATYSHPTNDLARQAVKIDDANGNQQVAQDGTGTVIGIIDTGIDYRHLDFTVPGSNGTKTRIKFLLDMTVYNPKTVTLPGGDTATIDRDWNFKLVNDANHIEIGRLYTEDEINASLAKGVTPQIDDTVKERDKNGHGTHVTGTAAGNGLASPTNRQYRGMAPKADLIIVKATRPNKSDGGFRTNDQINGMQFIEQKANALGKPFVINMSLGGNTGPHIGVNDNEVAINNIVDAGPGRAVCVASGNEGDIDMHASGNIAQGGDIELTVDARDLFADGNPNVSIDFFEFYYSAQDKFSVTITKPDGKTLGPYGVPTDLGPYPESTAVSPDPAIEGIFNDLDKPVGMNDIYITFMDSSKNLGSNWKFKIHGDSVKTDGHFNVWLGGGQFDDDANPATPPPAYVDGSRRISSPGTARGAITVGAYVVRSQKYQIGSAAKFTGQGPTANGLAKPDISAPGYYLYSTKSADSATNPSDPVPSGGGPYVGFSGTSMSTPVVTGAVALIFQANRNLTSEQVKSLIANSADHDSFTKEGWSPRFGFGKLNVAKALAAATIGAPNVIDDSRTFVQQQYLDFLFRKSDPAGENFWTGEITSCGGEPQCVDRKRVNTSGAYFLSTEFQATGYFVYRLYKGAFNRMPLFTEFTPDEQTMAAGIVVNDQLSPGIIETNKTAFATKFVSRPEFQVSYGGLNNQQYVDKLIANTGETLSAAERDALINGLTNGQESRATVLLKLLDGTTVTAGGTTQFSNNYAKSFYQRESNPAFVLMQYFGYLKRDPDTAGFNFWLAKLNQYGNFTNAEMVRSFIVSNEYRQRFGLK